ncbi:hypothetical protein CY34DRAFT_811035 [Suillus luteus UH-Slu-Lm8-n1]|uniref:Uncharacterized protein n=1 Tax=Suillus luteus UH-Slu-Lm8-n1 TaxID=930992 RepID=A0A0D0AF29_9AGAM|nr:hypothetical protein CY34DRAFT_811035 [Suillus luteus UH-Slu-Lm8-n1]
MEWRHQTPGLNEANRHILMNSIRFLLTRLLPDVAFDTITGKSPVARLPLPRTSQALPNMQMLTGIWSHKSGRDTTSNLPYLIIHQGTSSFIRQHNIHM